VARTKRPAAAWAGRAKGEPLEKGSDYSTVRSPLQHEAVSDASGTKKPRAAVPARLKWSREEPLGCRKRRAMHGGRRLGSGGASPPVAGWSRMKRRDSPAHMPKTPSPRGARPRRDIRPRVLAALTPEPSTATEIAERAGLPGRERTMHATRALIRLEADGLAVSETHRNWTRWRSASAAPASARPEPDPEA
jgi:hypothetical protein